MHQATLFLGWLFNALAQSTVLTQGSTRGLGKTLWLSHSRGLSAVVDRKSVFIDFRSEWTREECGRWGAVGRPEERAPTFLNKPPPRLGDSQAPPDPDWLPYPVLSTHFSAEMLCDLKTRHFFHFLLILPCQSHTLTSEFKQSDGRMSLSFNSS